MGKVTGFIEIQRKKQPVREVAERLRDWNEVYLPYPDSALKEQAARCMDCGIPFCHQACPLGINNDPVTIKSVEVSIIDRAFEEGWVAPVMPETRTGRSVAVVGSGPAGLAVAAQLNRAGHTVTVFERDDRIGGLLRYGIPEFKMEKRVLD